MAGPRPEKVAAVEEVRDHLERSSGAILTDYRGLKVGDLAALRRALRVTGAQYKIYKNTLVRRATAESGHDAIFELLVGPTAIAFVDDDVAAAAKVLRDFARTHPALIVKGSLIGTDLLDARSTTALADLPPRELLLAQIAGALAAPLQKFAGLVQALPRNFAYGLSALVEKRVAGGEVLPEPPAAADATNETNETSSASETAEEAPAVAADAPAPAAEGPASGEEAPPGAADAPAPAAEAEAVPRPASDEGAGSTESGSPGAGDQATAVTSDDAAAVTTDDAPSDAADPAGAADSTENTEAE